MFDPRVLEVLFALLKCVTVLLVAFSCLPGLLAALGLAMYRNGVQGGPADLQPDGSDPVYTDLHDQLVALGFQPLGIHWEATLGFPHFRRSEEYTFRTRRGDVLATVTRMFGDYPGVYFLSVFTSGGAILTSNYEKSRQEEENYLTQGIVSGRLEEVLAEHQRALDRFAAAGQSVRAVTTLEVLEEVQRVYFDHPVVQRSFRRVALQKFLSAVSLIGFIPGFMWLGYWTSGAKDFVIPWLAQFGFAVWYVGVNWWSVRKVDTERAQAQTEAREHGAARSSDAAAPPRLVAEFVADRDKMISTRQVRLRCALADLCADWMLPRPWAFDIERGWLRRNQKIDFVQTLYCPSPTRDRDASPQPEPFSQSESAARNCAERTRSGTTRRIDDTPQWKWSATDSRRFKSRLVYPVMLAHFARGLVSALLFVGIVAVVELAAACANLGNVLPFAGRLDLTLLFLFGVAFLVNGFVVVVNLPTIAASFAPQLGRFKRSVAGEPQLEFRYPEAAADHNQEPIRCLIPLKEQSDGSFVAHGLARFWHVNGQFAAEVPFDDGRADGSFLLWHPNGQKKLKGQWAAGHKMGTWRYWNSEGTVSGTAKYEFDTLLGGRPPHDAARDLRSHHWAMPLLLDPNLPPKSMREAFKKNRRPMFGWWADYSPASE